MHNTCVFCLDCSCSVFVGRVLDIDVAQKQSHKLLKTQVTPSSCVKNLTCDPLYHKMVQRDFVVVITWKTR